MPPFTLRMLLVWVGICAVLLEFWRQSDSLPRDLPWQSLLGIQLILWSAGLSGLGMRLWWWKQGRNIPWQPGHWLLCLVGCIGLSAILTKLVQLLFWRVDPFPNEIGLWIQTNIPLAISSATSLVMWGVVFFAPMRHVWRLAILPDAILRAFSWGMTVFSGFAALLMDPNQSMAKFVLFSSYVSISTIRPLPILILALWDGVMNQRPRDWMHWAGVAAWSLLMLFPFLTALVVTLTGTND